MRVMHPLRLVLAASLTLPYLGVLAQDVTLPDLVKGEKLAATMKAADLPDDFKAVKLSVSGESGLSDMFSGPYGMIIAMSGGMRGNGNEAAQAELFSMMQLSWTKGEVVHLLSADSAAAKAAGAAGSSTQDEYLVTYKADLDVLKLMAMSAGNGKSMSTDLKLALVKVASISAITPEPEITKERLVKALEGAASLMSSTRTPQGDTTTVPATTAPQEEQPGMSPDQSRSVSNAKQLALGTIMYCSDNDDVLPYVQSVVTVKEVIRPYLKNDNLWNTANPASQWRFNMCVGGVSMTDIPEPASTPLFYESAPWSDGRRVVAYTDGHVKLIGDSEWKNLAKYLRLKLKRTAKAPLPVHQPGLTGPVPPPAAPTRTATAPPGK